MPSLPGTLGRQLALGTIVLLLLTSSFTTGVSTQKLATGTDVFISDDPDPDIGDLPPFIQPDLRTILQSDNISAVQASRVRDFSYPTSQPSYEVGPRNQTLAEYRSDNLRKLPHNRSTSVWFLDSNRSNGTVVKNAHVTILGTQNGTQTRLGQTNTSSQSRFLLPRNGTILTHLDYSTAIPNRTCMITNGTKTCINYTISTQSVNRSLRIGSQSWTANETSQEGASRPLAYTNAQATGQTTMVVRATIKTQLTRHTTTAIRTKSGWERTNTTSNTTLLSHTVRDTVPVVITPNQRLNATQTLVTSNGDIKRIVITLDGPKTLSDRRHWSYATFKSSQMRLQNVWGIYSQHRYSNATKGTQRPNTTQTLNISARPSALSDGQINRSLASITISQETLPPPNVLEKQLIAVRSKPAIAHTGPQTATTATVDRVYTVPLTAKSAPLKSTVNLSSVPPRASTRIVITNVDQPLTNLYDIHGNEIPLATKTASEHPVSLTLTKQDKRHVRIELTDAQTGEPVPNQSIYLHGAVQGHVTTNSDGVAVVTRNDSAVEATFRGDTTNSKGVYYAPSHERIRFAPTPFNIYSALLHISKGFVSVIAFVLFYLPFHYLRRR
ncbi:hypothetical protein [Haladaptatus halobius]|uniref:hypothetical protein n=1 Tax=Haladaptatus halobius TaxID=2884875 RepID=UPI001D0AA77D|nr:hypothetical protein [Haladaptatus halobius]